MFSDLSSYKIISISHLPLSSHLFICRSTPLPSHISTHLYMYERIGTTWCKLCNQCRSIGSFYSRSSARSFSSPAVLALLEMAGSRIKSTPLLFGSPFSCGDIGDTDTDTQMGRAASIGLARSAPAPYWTLGIPYQWHVLFPSTQREESESWLFPRISMLEQSCQWVGGSSSVTGTDHCRRVADHHVHKWPDVDQVVVRPPTTHCPPWMCTVGHCWAAHHWTDLHTWQSMHWLCLIAHSGFGFLETKPSHQ